MFKEFIACVAEGQHLSQEETTRAFQIIMNGGATPAQIAALLIGLRMKGETVGEIAGAASVMRAKMDTIPAPEGTIDVCGTGGDAGRNHGGTLNVSTAVALVVAGCGVPVAKHGNKSVSSQSGSADVLATLGVNIQTDKDRITASLHDAGICFMFAPIFHKAMRHVAPIRQELGIRTLFNLIGPLANPAMPKRQLIGVYDKALLEIMAKALRSLGSEKAWLVHGSDGMDELTLTGVSYVAELNNNEITSLEITPEAAGLERVEPGALSGKGPEHNARELSLLLNGKVSPYRDIVLLNAAAALMVADKAADLKEGAAMAAQAIDSGTAQETLANLVKISNT